MGPEISKHDVHDPHTGCETLGRISVCPESIVTGIHGLIAAKGTAMPIAVCRENGVTGFHGPLLAEAW